MSIKEKPEGKCKWSFADLGNNVLGQGAQNAIISHFNKSPYASLIRESIQNSLDAKADPSIPVRLEYSFSRIQASEYPNFFELREHIKGIPLAFPHNLDASKMAKRMLDTFQTHMNNQQMPFIKVSDFNTTGMRYRARGEGLSPFTSFLRVAGDSLKNNAGSGGSFGFGKAAYFNISPIRTVLVSTRTSDNEVFFEGGAMLTDHIHGGIEKSFYGFYDTTDGIKPTSNPDDIPLKFRRELQGTDFYIMGVKATDLERTTAYNEMIEAVLRNFWFAIYNRQLEVKIGDTEINYSNLASLLENYFDTNRDDTNRSDTYNPRPYFEAVSKAGTNSNHLLIKNVIDHLGEVQLYIKKVKNAKDKVAYFRSQRMYVNGRQFQTSYGCYCVFLCDNEEGNALLRRMENASHKEWDPSNMDSESNIGRAAVASIKSFISDSLESLFASDSDTPLGISGLEEFLYLDDDMLPSEDEDIKSNPFLGNISGEFDKEGTSMSSVLNPYQPKIRELPQSKQGQVTIKTKTKAKSDSKGELGGNDKHPSEGKHNETPSPGNKPKTEDDNGKEGTYREFIPVRYRVVASKNLQGKMEHTIIIHSPKDIEEAMLELLIAGEQDTEVMEIFDSLQGDFKDNQVFGLTFSKGRNEVTVQFADNLKHPVVLKSYEYK